MTIIILRTIQKPIMWYTVALWLAQNLHTMGEKLEKVPQGEFKCRRKGEKTLKKTWNSD